jgi:hypothetical protein
MKKIFMLALACIVMLGAQAQIVSSRSVTIKKTETTTTNYIRLGVGFMNVHDSEEGESADSKVGYNFTWGFQKPITDFNLYYDFDLGLGSRGYKLDDDGSFIAHNIQVAPVNIGWKPTLTDNLKFDVHIGAYASFDYAGKLKSDDYSIKLGDFIDLLDEEDISYKRFDVGLNVGVGVWYDRFNLDLSYQAGCIEMVPDTKSRTFLLRLGVAF